MPSPRRSSRSPLCVLALATFATLLMLAPHASFAAPASVHAIVNARIVPAPGRVIERGTIVMRDGVITAVGANVAVPKDARVWVGDSLTVYSGLIDACVFAPEAPSARGAAAPPRGAAHALATVHPETRVAESLVMPDSLATMRAAGFAIAHFVPRRGIVRGTSAIVGLSDAGTTRSVVKADAAQVMSVELDPNGYPGSLQGSIAVLRQTFSDAGWYRDVWSSYRKAQGKPRPESNVSLEALAPAIARTQPVWFLSADMLQTLRIAAIAREAGIDACVIGNGDEYKRAAAIAATGLPLVVPVRFPDAPDVSGPDEVSEVTTEELRHWNAAPGNAAALAKAGARFALTAHGLKDPKTFRANVAKAIARGLDRDVALAAVTTVPAQLLGLSDRTGTLAVGKAANLTVTRGGLFDENSKVVEVWVDGRRHEIAGPEPVSAKGTWDVAWGKQNGRLVIAADTDTSIKLVVGGDSLKATAPRLEANRARFDVALATGKASFDLRARSERLMGTVNGAASAIGVRFTDTKKADEARRKNEELVPLAPAVMGDPEAWRAARPAAPPVVLVRHATVWTAGPAGTLADVDVLVTGGKITKVGKGLVAPRNAIVIDGTGKHVAPGIIDAHSHSAILGGVNECTNNITAEVRIQDVINSESINIYRQLAGGTTMMHLLHGSCNAIGGQAAVIKNTWGDAPDALRFAAPATIKFALGENPKQSNYGSESSDRYPKSRAGVEQLIRSTFSAARDYGAARQEWSRGRQPYPPQRDLQKEAVLEILEGKRLIHAHSYRQDEILMLMRVAEEFGVKVQTFQHVLEGYKVADEMAAHGAGASSFSDWWAYKYEVVDAIPYNGYLMWDRGVNVSFNSDSEDLARRLNTEAAKAVKYGGVPPEEAIKFVTLNPAKQLRIDDRVGSLEPGKDADFSVWNGSPLSPYSLCEQTWIEGRKYFDRAADLAGREVMARERDALIAQARGAKKGVGTTGDKAVTPRYLEEDNHEHGCDEVAVVQ